MENFDDFCLIKAYEKDEKYFLKSGVEPGEVFSQVPENSMEILSAKRFAFIDEILEKCSINTQSVYGKSKLDKIFLNKWLAFPMFLAILAGVFYLTFFSTLLLI